MTKRERSLINLRELKTRRRELRNDPTPEEAALWTHLKGRQILGKKFRRQCSIGRYIADFFCFECDIAIELDGAVHFRELGEEYEGRRTLFLQGLGIEVLRFENHVIRENMEAVLETIREAIRNRSESDLPGRADSRR